MRYLGGKTRQCKWLREEVARLKGNRWLYIEPFVGGGSVLATLAPLFTVSIASDIVPELVQLHAACARGWVPPATMTRDEYEHQREAPPSAMKAWAAYAASYNGKYFAGYGPCAAGRDYLGESQRSILKKAAHYRDTIFVCCSYAEQHAVDGAVIYCDPPYLDTEGYQGAGAFDHTAFWRWADAQHDAGALVLVTEYTAPSHWRAVSHVERVETMNHSGPSSGVQYETLYARAA